MVIKSIKFDSKAKLAKAMRDVKAEITDALYAFPIESTKLAEQSAKWMSQKVKQKTKRADATGRLAESLAGNVVFRRRGKGFSLGIGNTSILPVYWAMINYGGKINMKGKKAVPGFWLDGDGRSNKAKKTGKFVYTRMGDPQRYYNDDTGEDYPYFWMKPQKRIQGFHYILYAHRKMLTYIKSRLKIFKRKKGK